LEQSSIRTHWPTVSVTLLKRLLKLKVILFMTANLQTRTDVVIHYQPHNTTNNWNVHPLCRKMWLCKNCHCLSVFNFSFHSYLVWFSVWTGGYWNQWWTSWSSYEAWWGWWSLLRSGSWWYCWGTIVKMMLRLNLF